jgi:hypothetical protein
MWVREYRCDQTVSEQKGVWNPEQDGGMDVMIMMEEDGQSTPSLALTNETILRNGLLEVVMPRG